MNNRKQVRNSVFAGLLVGAAALATGCAPEPPPAVANRTLPFNHLVDLTHTLNAAFPFIPVRKLTYPFKLIPMATLAKNGVAANSWQIHEHLGTHIDAPNHFIAGEKSLDQIALEDLIVPVVVVDISAKAGRNRDATLSVEDLRQFETHYGKIPAHCCVMMYSGWEKHLNDSLFVGLDRQQKKHYPGFSNEAIQFLVAERNIAGIGVDVLSFDPGTDENYTGHKILFAAGKWGVECVANLAKIPKTGATLLVGAPKVEGATGGFARIMAIW